MNQEDRTDGGRSGSRRAETRSGTRSAEGRSSTAADRSAVEDDRSPAADDKGASAGQGTKRRTVLAAAMGLVAGTGLAGCTIRADTDSIQIDFDDGDGDGAEPGAGDDDPTDGTDDDAEEDTPTARPDGDGGGTGEDGSGGGGGGGDDPDDETPTASPTPTPVELEESIISMLTVYDDVAVEFESAAAQQVSEMAEAALAEGVYQDEAEYRAFVESAFNPQRNVAEEIVGVATADSTNAYEAAVVNLAEALNERVEVHALARAQNDVTVAAGNLERD